MSDTFTSIKEASGSTLNRDSLKKDNQVWLTFNVKATPEENTDLINEAIDKLNQAGGGTVCIPAGAHRVYTIVLKSNVNLFLEEGAVIQAAKTDIDIEYIRNHIVQKGEGGNYLRPEVNKYCGIQDHGHSYFANSLVYAADAENIMIYGKGLFDGSFLDEKTGSREFVLLGADPENPAQRSLNGENGFWFGNKGIALVNCKNIVLTDFSIIIGGHFAIITEGVTNLFIDSILVDTNRDALDLDCCQDVTVTNSTFNSLTDDGVVVKASYGAGRFFPSKNILIEDCIVSGYDAGTVYAGTYTKDKKVADDMCGPTGRVKLGTESTCGYERVTVRRVKFDRSRGFALEAVDGAPLKDIIFEDSEMSHVSSSPIFIRAGERGRYPVTGKSDSDAFPAKCDVRLDHPEWVLPNSEDYDSYPATRFTPSYNKTKKVCIDGIHEFTIVDDQNPAKINEANLCREGDVVYPLTYDKNAGKYVADKAHPLTEKRQEYYYANANGSPAPARVSNIRIRNIHITDVDPRYPILLMGLLDSPIENVELSDISVTYRGGITMEQAVEQRQIMTEHTFSQFGTAALKQPVPWQINPFFVFNEGRLPRVDWDEAAKSWIEDPYNVPELPESYPEPSNWGILPAYGLYARHIKGLKVSNVKVSTECYDERHALVLDDACQVSIDSVLVENTAAGGQNTAEIALVTDHFRRPTNLEYIKDQPYLTTSVDELEISNCSFEEIKEIEINSPAPGTPCDSLYSCPTVATPETGYMYKKSADEYPLPKTVFPDLV